MNNLTNEQWAERLAIKKEIVCSAQNISRPQRGLADLATSLTATVTSGIFFK